MILAGSLKISIKTKHLVTTSNQNLDYGNLPLSQYNTLRNLIKIMKILQKVLFTQNMKTAFTKQGHGRKDGIIQNIMKSPLKKHINNFSFELER